MLHKPKWQHPCSQFCPDVLQKATRLQLDTTAGSSHRLTWEKPCCPVRQEGCAAYWTTGSGRPGWATWRCRAGFGWGCCRWCAVPSGGWVSIASCSDFSPSLRLTRRQTLKVTNETVAKFTEEEKVGRTDQISPARPSRTSSHWPPPRLAWWCNICEDLEDHIFPLAYLLIWKERMREPLNQQLRSSGCKLTVNSHSENSKLWRGKSFAILQGSSVFTIQPWRIDLMRVSMSDQLNGNRVHWRTLQTFIVKPLHVSQQNL